MWWLVACSCNGGCGLPDLARVDAPVVAPQTERDRLARTVAARAAADGPEVGLLHVGLPVERGAVSGALVQVVAADGTIGWVPLDALRSGILPALPRDGWLPVELRARMDAVGAKAAAARTRDALLAAWREAREVAREVGPPLNGALATDETAPILELQASHPWFSPVELDGWLAGSLDVAFWAGLAAKTPEPEDDALFAWTRATFGAADLVGVPPVLALLEPYHGCSGLGQPGSPVVAAFRATGPLAALPEVAAARAQWAALVTSPPAQFPHCLDVGVPTPPAELAREVDDVLALADLSDAERALFAGAKARGFGAPPVPEAPPGPTAAGAPAAAGR